MRTQAVTRTVLFATVLGLAALSQTRAASIQGQITCNNDKHTPAAGVTVSLIRKDAKGDELVTTISKAAGDFAFGNLTAGIYQLTFDCRGRQAAADFADYYIPRTSEKIELGDQTDARNDVVALLGVTVVGTVFLDGKPLPGAMTGSTSRTAGNIVKTDKSGAYRLSGLKPDEEAVVIIQSSATLMEYARLVKVPADKMKAGASVTLPEVTFAKLSGTKNLTGSLKNADSTPVAGIRPLPAVSEDGKTEFFLICRDGSFAIELFPGKYRIYSEVGKEQGDPIATIQVPGENIILKLP